MPLFRRSRPLHEQLAADAGLSLTGEPKAAQPAGPAAAPPGWDGEQRGEPGIHGVPRTRRWDVVATATAPEALGDELSFVVLPDGTVLIDDDQPDGALVPLADAVEASLAPPYRAEAVRRGPEAWAIGARRIAVAEERGLRGDEAELVSRSGVRTLTVDGIGRIARAQGLESAGERLGGDYVVRATRLEGDLWEVEATAL
jgi:hypothetical protein